MQAPAPRLELVEDRQTRQPVNEKVAMKVAGACMKKGLIIGRTNRSSAISTTPFASARH
jgi:adenosylmethionine-8-amino-7-oxononanoate aminotransferase